MAFNINLPQKHERYNNRASFPATGSAKILYVANDTSKLYTYANGTYTEVNKELASSWGSLSQAPKPTSTSITKSDIGLGNVDDTSDFDKPISNATQSVLDNKQDILSSGVNIKTINSTSILGSGNVSVQPTLVSGTNIKTINGGSVLGSGDLTINASASWGGITGTLSSQTDLNTALNARVNKTNTLVINGIAQDLSAATRTWNGIARCIGIKAGDQTVVTGTTNDTRTASIWIPANTFSGGTTIGYSMQVIARITKTGVNGTQKLSMYINTNDTLTGATLISTHAATAAGNTYVQQMRNFSYDGQLKGILTTGTNFTDIIATTSPISSTTFASNTGYWLIFSIQLGSTLDSSVLNYAQINVYGY